MTPRSKDGKPVEASDYNRSDGFSPGQIIVTLVPGLDLARSRVVPNTDMGQAFARRQPVVVIDAKTLKRQLVWAELNVRAEDPAKRTLNIHPGVGWKEGRRYIVALRNLKRADGSRDPGAPGLPGLPRPAAGAQPGRRAPPRALRGDLLQAAPRGHPPRRPLPGLGLHGRRAARA